MSSKVVTLDVREDIRSGREPFGRIMQAVSQLGEDQDLLIIAPFEPAPLYAVLAQRGFTHSAKARPDGDWEVLFTRAGHGQTPAPRPPVTRGKTGAAGSDSTSRAAAGSIREVDARGLEPPGPLVKILEALAALPRGWELRALTDRRPMHLYAQLEERGFSGQTVELADGGFLTYVRPR